MPQTQPPTFISSPFFTKTLIHRSTTKTLTPQQPPPIFTTLPKRPHQPFPHHLTPKALVIEINSQDDLQKVFAKAVDHLVVIDYSTTWCGPCKVIAPKFEEMSEEHKDVVFVKVMGDSTSEAGALMKKEGVRSVPAFHFWKSGERVLQVNGAKAEAIEQGIVEHK